jgi:hypothetical protein
MFDLFDILSNILIALASAGVTGSIFVLALELGSALRKQVMRIHASRCAKHPCFVHRRWLHS